MIAFECLQCGAKIRAKDERAGAKVSCPSCKKSLTVPQPFVAVATPVAAVESDDHFYEEFQAPQIEVAPVPSMVLAEAVEDDSEEMPTHGTRKGVASSFSKFWALELVVLMSNVIGVFWLFLVAIVAILMCVLANPLLGLAVGVVGFIAVVPLFCACQGIGLALSIERNVAKR